MSKPTAAFLSDSVAFSAVTAANFDELVAIRITAMRDSLERVGRFDPERARERLRKSIAEDEWDIYYIRTPRINEPGNA